MTEEQKNAAPETTEEVKASEEPKKAPDTSDEPKAATAPDEQRKDFHFLKRKNRIKNYGFLLIGRR